MQYTDVINTALAAGDSVDSLISKINKAIVNPLIVLMIGAALVVFIWGVIEFMANADNEEKRNQGKRHIIYGIVGLFIMVAVGGLIQIIMNFLNSL